MRTSTHPFYQLNEGCSDSGYAKCVTWKVVISVLCMGRVRKLTIMFMPIYVYVHVYQVSAQDCWSASSPFPSSVTRVLI